MTAALARWPIAFMYKRAPVAATASYGFLLILAAYDLWCRRKLHRVTLRASAFLMVVHQIRIPIGNAAAGTHLLVGRNSWGR